MKRYATRRLLQMIPVILIITFGVASLMRLVPGDPTTLALGQAATEADREKFREANHLNDSLPEQYIRWWGDVFHGNLGNSVVSRDNVTDELKQRLPSTLELLIFSLVLTIIIGIPLGILSAIRQNSVLDYFIRIGSIMGLSIPSFWLGTLLLLFPAIWWGYLPPLGKVAFTDDPLENLRQYSIPSFCLAVGASAGIMRLMRSSVLEIMRNDYIRTAYAKGLRERLIIFRHVLKNALIPVVTVLGLQAAGLMGGAVIIETIFTLQGVGLLFINSITVRDYPVVQGLVLFLGVIFLLINLLVDVSYGWLDPRIRYS